MDKLNGKLGFSVHSLRVTTMISHISDCHIMIYFAWQKQRSKVFYICYQLTQKESMAAEKQSLYQLAKILNFTYLPKKHAIYFPFPQMKHEQTVTSDIIKCSFLIETFLSTN